MRNGEVNYNNFGSKMIIVEYRNNKDVDIYFPKYDWIAKNNQYDNFKKGNIKCPYEPRYYSKGYLGEGKYKVKENGKHTKSYNVWYSVLQRCYDNKFKKSHPTYEGCTLCKEWLNYQNFAEWFYNNYYEIEGERIHLDKDILVKGNKIYSPETCIFVPQRINSLFTKSNNSRGENVLGVCKINDKYIAQCNSFDFKNKKSKSNHLGLFINEEDAFRKYKEFKENHIKEIANFYKNKIPSKLYNALINYSVDKID